MIAPDRIVRSRRKTLALSFDALGRLTVKAPLRCSEERISAFVREKQGWLEKHKSRFSGVLEKLPKEDLDGFSFLLLGKLCTVRLYGGKRVMFDEGAQSVFVPQERPKERLTKWLKGYAKEVFALLTENCAKRMGVSARSVGVSSAKGRWGSCSANGGIRYTFRLVYAPVEVIEYVVVHELCHLKVRNHSKAFWREVEKALPDYQKKRAWLKAHAYLTEIF